MSFGFKLIVPSVLSLYLAVACAPDLDSLSASYSSMSVGGTTSSGGSDVETPEGGSGNTTSHGGSAPVNTDTCANEVKDSKESDVDCGGTSKCVRCARNAKCTSNNDCDSSYCKNGRCTDPTCTDGVLNQEETGTDCGGPCLPCDLDVPCATNADCDGDYCKDNGTMKVCADHCTSGVKEADETSADCGGSCSPCADNKSCKVAADCISKLCVNGSCQKATCTDQVLNQDESDIDCGGACVPAKACAVNLHCNSEADCASWICSKTTAKCLEDAVAPKILADDIIDDFEDGDLALPALGTPARVGGWYGYGDGSGTVTEDIATINRGASLHGIHGSGKNFTSWGSGIGVDLNASGGTKQTWDASAYNAVTLWARVSTPTTGLAVTFLLPDIDTDKLTVGHTCDGANSGCDHHYFKSLAVTTGWQRFTIPFDDLTLEPGGSLPNMMPVPPFNKAKISSVQFRVQSGITYELYVDDIAFVKL